MKSKLKGHIDLRMYARTHARINVRTHALFWEGYQMKKNGPVIFMKESTIGWIFQRKGLSDGIITHWEGLFDEIVIHWEGFSEWLISL